MGACGAVTPSNIFWDYISAGCYLTMRKSVLERDYLDQQTFSGGGAIFRSALIRDL